MSLRLTPAGSAGQAGRSDRPRHQPCSGHDPFCNRTVAVKLSSSSSIGSNFGFRSHPGHLPNRNRTAGFAPFRSLAVRKPRQLRWVVRGYLAEQSPPPALAGQARADAPLISSVTLNAATGLRRPFSSRFPRSSSLATASTAPAMRLLTRICPSLASAQSRAARLHTVPIAV
jgi:hypothetical protein